MPREIDLARALVLLGAATVLISLFLDFYDTEATGWEVFEALDLVLAALALGAAAAVLRRGPAAGVWAYAPPAILAVLLVQLVEPPPSAAGADPDNGMWVALGGALLMTAGALLTFARIAVRIDIAERARAAAAAPSPAPAPPSQPAAGEDETGRLLADDDAAPRTGRFAREPEQEAPPAGAVREVPAVDRRREAPERLDETQPFDARPE